MQYLSKNKFTATQEPFFHTKQMNKQTNKTVVYTTVIISKSI